MGTPQGSLPGNPVSRALPAFLQSDTVAVPAVLRPTRKPVPAFVSDLLIVVALAVATFLLYLPALSNNFVDFDDPRYVTSNPVVKRGMTLHGISWAFTTSSVANWQPMLWLSHLATVSLFGLDPRWHHAVNIILHACNASLVFLVLRSMTGRRWCAALVAALFAFHPLRVESVAWVTERKDVLSGFFFLLTLLAYAHYVHRPSGRRYGLVLALFAFALMSKTVVVTLPFLLLLLDFWPFKRGRWTLRTLGEKAPLLLMSVIASAWTVALQRNGTEMNQMKGQELWSLGQRAANAGVSVARYLMKTFWPTNLSPFYPHPGSWPAGVVIASFALIVAVTLITWRLRERMPYVLVGWLWFLGMLFPVCGLVQAGLQSMADRYTYLPSIGLMIALVWAGVQVARDANKVLVPFAVLVLAALAAVSWRREAVWRTTLDLFQDALAADEHNWKAHEIVGAELVKKGDDAGAMRHFQRSAELNSLNPFSLVDMGTVLRRHGKTDEAVALFRKAVDLAPEAPLCHQWLGLGLAMKHDFGNADREFAVATRLDPDDPSIPAAWALTMAARGRLDQAKELAGSALDIDATDPLAIDAMQKIRGLEEQGHRIPPKAHGLSPTP